MNELTSDENVNEVRGKQVMIDSEISVTRCNGNMVNTL